jgi:hypothetical protein
LAINETRLASSIEGYDILRSDRKRNGGWLCTYVRCHGGIVCIYVRWGSTYTQQKIIFLLRKKFLI